MVPRGFHQVRQCSTNFFKGSVVEVRFHKGFHGFYQGSGWSGLRAVGRALTFHKVPQSSARIPQGFPRLHKGFRNVLQGLVRRAHAV